ncbi:MAG: type II secretion system protein [Pseudonocardiales bacterium]|nr:type II secretion system GspH family protein [Actinomycetota bacterium]
MAAARRVSGDAGTTLVELMVGMTVMTIVMAIFTTSILSMFSSTNKTQAVVNSSAQLDTAFDRLDAQVRYASVIDPAVQPPATQTYWSVTFQTDDPTSTTCRQLSIRPVGTSAALSLLERTWAMKVNPSPGPLLLPAGPVSQSQLATGLALDDQNGVAVTPFKLVAAAPADGTTIQRLHVQLVAVDGANKAKTRSFSDIWFSALNSATPSDARSYPATGPAVSICATEPTP